ncbi:MAG TPA: ADOP family duplicated permease [Vicinamibacterales bacterium]|nr:ADOP family duplicated permease [Vicinamibacterales bacterium]
MTVQVSGRYMLTWRQGDEMLLSDLRFAARVWRKFPGTGAAALLSLTLGIGANAIIFTFVKEMLLPRLPVADASHVVIVYSTTVNRSGDVSEYQTTSFPNAVEVQQRNDVFSGVSIVVDTGIGVEIGNATASALLHLVSGGHFAVLGVRAQLGRTITPDDDVRSASTPPVVLSDSLWRSRFGGSRSAVGTLVRLNGQTFVVVGIAPPDFRDVGALGSADLWVPLSAHDRVLTGNLREWFTLRAARVCTMVARLRPGIPVAEADASLRVLGRALAGEFPENAGRSFMAVPLDHTIVPPAQRRTYLLAGWMLSAVVGVVLLIACANVANLLLGRATERQREFSVRMALGASRRRLAAQQLTEALLLSAAAGAMSLLCAYGGRLALLRFIPTALRPDLPFAVDDRVLAFTLIVSVAATAAFGLVPALRASQADAAATLDNATLPLPRQALAVRSVVVAQTALSYVAVVVAVLFVRSLLNAQAADLGFEVAREVVVSLDLAARGYDDSRAQQVVASVLDRVRANPGVESASAADSAPLRGGFRRTTFAAGADMSDPSSGRLNTTFSVAPGFFAAAGMRLERGRDFTDRDGARAPMVAIVNDTAARLMWPGADPIGQRLRFLLQAWDVTVVGVVNTVTVSALGEAPQPSIYFPLRQHPVRQIALYVKARSDAAAIAADAVAAVAAVDADLRPQRVRVGEQIVDDVLVARRIGARLLAMFGSLALMLSTVGVYGVASYSVALRAREIAIRRALGATRLRIVRMVVAQTAVPVLAGLALGTLAAAAGTRALTSLTFGVSQIDPLSFTSGALVMLLAPVAASLLAAGRSTHADPMQALRSS